MLLALSTFSEDPPAVIHKNPAYITKITAITPKKLKTTLIICPTICGKSVLLVCATPAASPTDPRGESEPEMLGAAAKAHCGEKTKPRLIRATIITKNTQNFFHRNLLII